MLIPEPVWYMLAAGISWLPLCYVLVKQSGTIQNASGATHRASETERREYFRVIMQLVEKNTLPASYAANLHVGEANRARDVDASVETTLSATKPSVTVDGGVLDERSEMEEALDPAMAQTG